MSKHITGIVAKNSLEYIEAVFNCYAADEVVVLLRDKTDKRIDITGVTKVIEPAIQHGWFTKTHQFRCDDALAQIAFTSGTEGEPKGVLLTHQALSDVTERLNSIMEVDETIREYVGIPVNFSFGLGRFRAVSVAGGQAYLPEHGFDPLEIRDMLSAGEINAISAVPSLWRVLLKNKTIFGSETETLKWIEIGSQYMSRKEKEELKALFPNANIAQHYGLTEASRTSFLRLDQTEGEQLESVGRGYGQTELKISDEGRICIRGPHVAQQLLKDGEYVANVDAEGWFHTSDLGRIDDGFLYYLGRADDLINCGGIKLSPDAVERELREAMGIKEGIAIAAVDDELTGHAVLVAYLSDAGIQADQLLQSTANVLSKFGLKNRNVVKLLPLDAFPVTTTNKVKRKDLAAAYAEIAARHDNEKTTQKSRIVASATLSDSEAKIAAVWCDVLKLDSIDADTSFYDLGGDSLSAIGALVAMESKGVPAAISKGMLQGMTIREISARLDSDAEAVDVQHEIRTPAIRNSLVINIIRGMMVLIVIFAHWHQGFVERIPFIDEVAFTALMAPLLAMGTPGFVLIYGVSAGFALYPLYEKDPVRLRKIFSKTVLFLSVGILALACVYFVEKLIVADLVTFTTFTNSFYSVLTYYALISATLYFWFALMNKSKYPVSMGLLIAVISYAIHMYFVKGFAVYQVTGLVEFIKLLFTAKYAYFLMLSGTMIGVSLGISLHRIASTSRPFQQLFISGPALIGIAIVIWTNSQISDPWNVWPIENNYLWRWLFYAGVIMILLALVEKAVTYYQRMPSLPKFLLQLLSITGILAFPLFVLHAMVMPMKAILMETLKLPDLFALVLPMGMFIVVCYFLYRKLYHVNFK